MNKAAAATLKKYRKVVAAADIKLPRSRLEFSRLLNEKFSEKLNLTTGVEANVEPRLVDRLYRLSVRVIWTENEIAFYRSIPSRVRVHARNFGLAIKHVDRSLEKCERAESSLARSANELRRGTLRFPETRASLLRLRKTLDEVKHDYAVMIPPSLRTPLEKRLANEARHRLKHLKMPLTLGSARLQYKSTEAVETEVRRFASGKVKNLDRLIASFFEAGLNRKVEAENVKTMRSRIRKNKTVKRTLAEGSAVQ